MQKVEDAKTELALRILLILSAFAGLLLVININPQAVLRINNSTYYLRISKSTKELTRGLSGVSSMPDNQGMLFVFPNPEKTCFWMKEMNFNLDIIWLNNLKKVDYFQKNLSPLTYPKLYCTPLNSRYVLEMNSGFVNKQHIHIGDKLNF
jgi:uncharacterized membrane protein (UPF0127 family)